MPRPTQEAPTETGRRILQARDARLEGLGGDIRSHATSVANARTFKAFEAMCEEIGLPSPLLATPDHVVAFLVWVATKGRSAHITHAKQCEHYRSAAVPRLPTCGCPRHYAFSTLKATRARLQAAFRDLGRTEPYAPLKAAGNPVNSAVVRRYMKAVAGEQTDARVGLVEQKRVMTSEQHGALVTHMLRQYRTADCELHRFLYLQDALFLAIDWQTLQRGADLCELQEQQVEIRRNAAGTRVLRIYHSRTKTARTPGSLGKPVDLEPAEGMLDPVILLEALRGLTHGMGIEWRGAPVFRTVRLRAWKGRSAGVTQQPALAADVRRRFNSGLTSLGLPALGLHSMRRGGVKERRKGGMSVPARLALGQWGSTRMLEVYDSEALESGSEGHSDSEGDQEEPEGRT